MREAEALEQRWGKLVTRGTAAAFLLVTLGVWWSARGYVFADTQPYLDMADGILHGRFSSEQLGGVALPETLRTPGYPLFLAACRLATSSSLLPRLLQLGAYLAAVLAVWSLVRRLTGARPLAGWIFLGLTTLALQLPFLQGYVNSDGLHLTAVALYVVVLCRAPSPRQAALAGVLAAVAFQLRPAFLPFPVAVVALGALAARERVRALLVHLAVYVALVLPFGAWNLSQHGVFKVTPLEGGGGAAHLGYWSFRLPPGYADHFHWGNAFIDDVFNPFPIPTLGSAEGSAAIAAYEAEWHGILAQLAENGLSEDKSDPARYRGQRSRFIAERDRLLWKAFLSHAREEPGFFALTRLYTFGRNFFTGLRPSLWAPASAGERVKLLVPPVVHLVGVVVPLVLVLVWGTRARWRVGFEVLLLSSVPLYYGAVHMAFLIGARYSAPSHLPLFAAFAVLATARRNTPLSSSQRAGR